MGWLGLKLAIPPGFATSVWPAAGVALAFAFARGPWTLPGVFVGSAAVSLAHGWPRATDQWMICAAIAAGATLQAWAGARLLRRFVEPDDPLENNRSVVAVVMLGGPVASVVNASVSVATLSRVGAIEWPRVWITWWTWWAGDTIGAAVVAPAVLLMLARGDAVSRRRLAVVVVPLLAVLATVVFFFSTVRAVEDDKRRAAARENAKRLRAGIEQQVRFIEEAVLGLERFLHATGEPSADDFAEFSSGALQRHDALQALEWVPRVSAAQRTSFEQVARAVTADFAIRERAADGRMRTAGAREEYYPVLHVAPLRGNEPALGYDLASQSDRAAGLMASASSGAPTITAPISLVQDVGPQPGFLLFAPVYDSRPAALPAPYVDVRAQLRGFALAVVRAQDLAQAAAVQLGSSAAVLSLRDAQTPGEAGVLLSGGARESMYAVEDEFPMAGRNWRMRYVPTPGEMLGAAGHHSYLLLLACTMFVAVLGMLLLLVTGQSAAVQREVVARTQQMRTAMAEAERASRAKSEFLAGMSHELRTPLNSILGFTRRVSRSEKASLSARSQDALSRVIANGEHLLALIEGVLDVARVESGRTVVACETLDVQALFDDLRGQFMDEAAHRGTELRTEVEAGAEQLYGDPLRIRQIMINLVTNAIKFTADGTINVRARPEPHKEVAGIVLEVADTGAGIANEAQSQLFDKFFQARNQMAASRKGTGLGLALVKELVVLHGGDVSVQSEVGRGSTFRIWLPEQGAEARDDSARGPHDAAPTPPHNL